MLYDLDLTSAQPTRRAFATVPEVRASTSEVRGCEAARRRTPAAIQQQHALIWQDCGVTLYISAHLRYSSGLVYNLSLPRLTFTDFACFAL